MFGLLEGPSLQASSISTALKKGVTLRFFRSFCTAFQQVVALNEERLGKSFKGGGFIQKTLFYALYNRRTKSKSATANDFVTMRFFTFFLGLFVIF